LQYEVREISAATTLPLRQIVLKPFLHSDDCGNPGDLDPSTFHLGLFQANALLSVGTFLNEPHVYFSAGNPFRLRGMATAPKYQGQGLGQILLQQGVTLLRKKQCDLLWCNARLKAFKFYEKMGFFYKGEFFDLDRIGPHKVMYKYLNSR
jgi:hypothetical protein